MPLQVELEQIQIHTNHKIQPVHAPKVTPLHVPTPQVTTAVAATDPLAVAAVVVDHLAAAEEVEDKRRLFFLKKNPNLMLFKK